jgi:hypothetical protein
MKPSPPLPASVSGPRPKYRAECTDEHPESAGWRVVSDDGMLCMYMCKAEAEMVASACNSRSALVVALDACRLRLMEHIEQSGCRADHEAFDMATAALARAGSL